MLYVLYRDRLLPEDGQLGSSLLSIEVILAKHTWYLLKEMKRFDHYTIKYRICISCGCTDKSHCIEAYTEFFFDNNNSYNNYYYYYFYIFCGTIKNISLLLSWPFNRDELGPKLSGKTPNFSKSERGFITC